MQYLWNIHCSPQAQHFIQSHLFSCFHEMLLIYKNMLLMEFPPFLGDYCSAGQHSELPACPTANFCAGELLPCQKHFWDGSAPSHPVSLWWQWAAASGTEPGVEALPAPRGSLWLLHCREEAAGGVYGSDVLFICFLKNRLHKGWAVFLWRARSAWYN